MVCSAERHNIDSNGEKSCISGKIFRPRTVRVHLHTATMSEAPHSLSPLLRRGERGSTTGVVLEQRCAGTVLRLLCVIVKEEARGYHLGARALVVLPSG